MFDCFNGSLRMCVLLEWNLIDFDVKCQLLGWMRVGYNDQYLKDNFCCRRTWKVIEA